MVKCIFVKKAENSFTHKPFAGEVGKMVADILGNKLGAQRA